MKMALMELEKFETFLYRKKNSKGTTFLLGRNPNS
jgi:hypothetical protein